MDLDAVTTVRKDIDDMVRELTPGTVDVSALLSSMTDVNKDKKFPSRWAHKKLTDDIRRIKKAQKAADKGDRPDDILDDDVATYTDALLQARLTVYSAVITVAAITTQEYVGEEDIEALHELALAVTSAQTGLGGKWKELRPLRAYSNAVGGAAQELRARLVALVELHNDEKAALTRIYNAAEIAGLNRKEARKIVANARAGSLKSEPFETLRKYWLIKLQPLVADGEDIEDLLDRRWS
jgi:hypothetical protein